ncbi:hypothetical protein Tco_0865128, partial [Tanacetum coccineum]
SPLRPFASAARSYPSASDHDTDDPSLDWFIPAGDCRTASVSTRTILLVSSFLIWRCQLNKRFEKVNHDYLELVDTHEGCASLTDSLNEAHKKGLADQLDEVAKERDEWRKTSAEHVDQVKELELDLGWLKGIEVGRKEEEVDEILKTSKNVDVDDLMKVMSDAPSGSRPDKTPPTTTSTLSTEEPTIPLA